MSIQTSFTSKSISTFTPESVLGLEFWLDATDTTTIQSSGNAVTGWQNKGTQNFTATPSLGTPTTGSNWSNLNYVSCPSGSRLGFTSAFGSSSDQTWFVVARGQNQVTTVGAACIFVRNAANDYFAVRRSTTPEIRGVFQIVLARANTVLISTSTADPVTGDPFGTVMSYCVTNDTFYPTIENATTVCGSSPRGLLTSTAAGGYTTASSAYTIGDTNNFMGWDFFEIMRYSRALSTDERLSVEGYIAQKYLMRTKAEQTFIPTSLSNCVLWLDAGSYGTTITSYASNSNWSTNSPTGMMLLKWFDKSGNGNDASSVAFGGGLTVRTENLPRGRTYIQFDNINNNYLYCPLSLPSNSPVTIFVVSQPNVSEPRHLLALNSYPPITRGNQVALVLGRNGGGTLQWFVTGGSPDTSGNLNASVVYSSSFRSITCAYWSPGSSQLFCQGAATPPSSSAAPSLQANAALMIGTNTSRRSNTGTPYENGFSGNMFEIIIYNRILSERERKLTENYLANKWQTDLASTTTFSHPFRDAIPQQRYFSPQDLDFPILFWIDAMDPSTFTLSGANLATITDKARTPSALTIGGTVGYDTTTLNNRASFNLSNGRIIANVLATPISNNTATVIFVGYLFNNPASITFPAVATNSTNTNPGGARWRVSEFNNTSTRNVWTNSSSQTVTITPAVATGTPYIWAGGLGPLTGSFRYTGFLNDGTGTNFTAAVSTNATIANQTHLRVGGDVSIGLTSNTYPGCIGEVIVYGGTLSLSELRRVSGYLCQKWDLTSYPQFSYYKSHNIGNSTSDIDPTGISPTNLKIWLDAMDINSTAETRLSNPSIGSTITTWYDKSDTPDVTLFNRASGTITYQMDGAYPGIYFDGGARMSSGTASNLPFSNFTVAVVGRTLQPGSNGQRFISDWRNFSFSAQSYWYMDARSSNGNAYYQYSPSVRRTFSNYTPSTDRSIHILVQSGTSNPQVWVNGNSLGISSSAGTITAAVVDVSDAGLLLLGTSRNQSNGTTNGNLIGYIHEVIAYRTDLNGGQRQRLEGYLAWKWGIVDNLPNTHPYKKVIS